MLTDPQDLQNKANRDFRDLASEEFDTRTLLRNAVDQAIARKYEDFLIVDTDSHHYETEAFKEIAEYIDDPGDALRGQIPGPFARRLHGGNRLLSGDWPAASRAIRCARPRRCRRSRIATSR